MRRISSTLTVLSLLFGAILSTTVSGCNDDATIGASLIQDQLAVTIDSSFTVTGQTMDIGCIQSRTVSKLIGRIEAEGFGRISSDFVAQFMPATSLDTANITVEGIDSLVLVMNIARDEYIGDSVAPLGVEVFKLDKILPSPIYSNFDPTDYYSPEAKLGSAVYNTAWNSCGLSGSTSYTTIRVPLPVELGREMYSKFLESPQTFASPTEFAKNVFPGVYVRNSFGSGRLSRISTTMMSLYYHYTYTNPTTLTDSLINTSGNYFAVTPEIISNNNIDLSISDNVKQLVADGEKIVLAPAGLEVKIRFPAPEILASFNANPSPAKVVNSLTFSVPAEQIANPFNVAPPQYMLLVLSSEKDKFFANNTLPDSKTSFYAEFNTTTGLYNFGEMRAYIQSLIDKGEITEDDYTFTLTPVSASFEQSSSSSSSYYYYYGYSTTSTTLSMLTPYVASPCMARLLLDEAKIKLSFSSQSLAK